MCAEHIGVVTGLSDLVNFLAALQKVRHKSIEDIDNVKSVLFGQKSSLPKDLQNEFMQITRDAFPSLDVLIVPPERVRQNEFDAVGYAHPLLFSSKRSRVVYGNSIHKVFHQSFYATLNHDEFVFFDNGLSSYADHKVNIAHGFSAYGMSAPRAAYLSLSPPLPVPDYLSLLSCHTMVPKDFTDIYDRLRCASRVAPKGDWLPEQLIIGTSLFRTGRITWDDERDLYLRLISAIRSRGGGDILFKAHPRASAHPLLTDADGVEVLDSSVPVEAFVKPDSEGEAYSISSTSLFTLREYFGWKTYRIESEQTRSLLARSPHLKLVDRIAPLQHHCL